MVPFSLIFSIFTSVSEIFLLTLKSSLSCTIPPSQADERYRKNIQGSPQTAPPPKQPPLPPRSSEPFSNGGSSSEVSAMHRPMEPQVTPSSSLILSSFSDRSVPPSLLDLCIHTGLSNSNTTAGSVVGQQSSEVYMESVRLWDACFSPHIFLLCWNSW